MENPFSQSKTLRKRLELSETKFRTVAETATDSIIITNENSIIIFANSKVEEVFGYTVEEITGSNLDIIIPDNYRESHSKGVERFLRTGKPKLMGHVVELEAQRKDGTIFPIELSLSYWREGDLVFFTGIIRDITERVQTQKAFKAINERSHLILNSLMEGVIVLDKNGAISFVNPIVEKLTGYTTEELLGRDQHSLLHHSREDGSIYPIEECPIYNVFNTGKPTGIDSEVYWKKDGTSFPVEYTATPIIEEGTLQGIVISFKDVTERRKSELELKSNEEKFRLLAENSSDMVSVHKPDGTILYISPSSELILGYTPTELIGTNALELYHPEDLEPMKKAYIATTTTTDILTLTFRARKKNGTYVWLESTGRMIKDSNGIPYELHAVNRNITERKKAEDALRESQLFIKRVVDSSPTIISVYDRVTNKNIYVNKELIGTLGYTQDEINQMGKEALSTIVHPEDVHKIIERRKKLHLLPDGESVESEVRVKTKNGDYRWIHSKSTTFKRTPEGEIWQTLTVSQDITDRKIAEDQVKKTQKELKSLNEKLESKVTERTKELHLTSENLKQSESLLKIIANILPAFVSYVDRNGVYQFANDFYANLPFVNESPVGKHIKDVLGDKVYNENKKYIDIVLQGESVTFTSQLTLRDNTLKEIQGLYLPDKDEDGNIRGFVVMGIDMTERMSYEKELSRRNKELRKTNNDLDNFIYTASHDLKAPIANIEGLINAIKDTGSFTIDSELASLIELMESSIERFKNTIIDLTEISRVQSGKLEKEEEVNFEDLLNEIQYLLKDIIKTTNAKLKSNFQVPSIKFSSRNMRSILFNLLSNALKYHSPLRSPSIEISTSWERECILICISDNGLGIPENRKDQIFRMFKRFHDHVEGSGVGLFIVKRIVDNAGGKIEVKSKIDKGTTIKIYLPQGK